MNKKELLEKIEETEEAIKNYKYDFDSIYEELRELAEEAGCEDYLNDYVDEWTAEELLKNEVENGGLARVVHFLSGVEYLNDNIFILDGYANLRNVTMGDFECTLYDIKREVEEMDDEEESEEA